MHDDVVIFGLSGNPSKILNKLDKNLKSILDPKILKKNCCLHVQNSAPVDYAS